MTILLLNAGSSSLKCTLLSRITVLPDRAPRHNPPSRAALAATEAELPGVPHGAVFNL